MPANRRASGPVLMSRFLAVLSHCVSRASVNVVLLVEAFVIIAAYATVVMITVFPVARVVIALFYRVLFVPLVVIVNQAVAFATFVTQYLT